MKTSFIAVIPLIVRPLAPFGWTSVELGHSLGHLFYVTYFHYFIEIHFYFDIKAPNFVDHDWYVKQ